MAGLNNRVTVLRQVHGRDSFGQPITSWEQVAELWADVRMISGAEAIRADKPTSTASASVKVRRRDDIEPGMQLRYRSTSFAISAVLEDARSRRFMFLVCEASR